MSRGSVPFSPGQQHGPCSPPQSAQKKLGLGLVHTNPNQNFFAFCMLSIRSLVGYSLADCPPPPLPEGLCSAGLLPTCVWEAPACLGDVQDTFPPLSALAAFTCVAAVQHHFLLALVSCCVLCPMRPTRRHILHSLGWGPRQALGVPLPLVVAPQGMPRQPCLCVLIMRDAQLHTEPLVWLSCIILGGGRWRVCITSSFLTGPLTTGWACCCTRCWGAVPFGLARRGGF
jgi:hypothetical protein